VSADLARPADAWDGGERLWDTYFAVVLAGTLALGLITESGTGPDRLAGSAALIAMAPWYLLAGRRAMYDDRQRRGTIYLAGILPLLAVAEFANGSETFILLALCPQAFMTVSYRRAIVAVVALNSMAVLVALARSAGAEELAITAGISALGIAFSVAFGTWVTKIISQSVERAELIAQLEQTRAELAEVSREAGGLAERNRLASEIHDTIAQGFTSIVMLVQAADALLESDPAQARRQLDLIGRTARENLAETRALVAGLAPAALDSATLPDALARLTDRIGQELGIEASFDVAGEPRILGTATEVVLLRICQEALSNVRKHAKASFVRVGLRFAADTASLEVSDDGVGFDAALACDGFGLRGMRTRIAEVGGRLQVRTGVGAGTTVSAEVP
jgi:signal transduction histidine kinase